MTGDTALVLVVEDDPAITSVLTEVLADEGYRVAAGIGGQGLALALADPPDIVLLDVMMPGMDGPEVCRRLRADPRTQDVPIVFVTALPPLVLRQRLSGCSHQGIIQKPFALDDLLTTVEHCVDS